jgi:hypothetical protein
MSSRFTSECPNVLEKRACKSRRVSVQFASIRESSRADYFYPLAIHVLIAFTLVNAADIIGVTRLFPPAPATSLASRKRE